MQQENVCSIKIYDKDFNWVGITELAESVQFNREFYGIGAFQIVINSDKRFSKELAKRGNVIVINNDPHKSGIVRDFIFDDTREGSTFTVYGEVGSGLLKQRIVVPPNQEQDSNALGWDRIAGNAETVLKHYVKSNVAQPFDQKRTIPCFVIAADKRRGKEFPAQLRYTNLAEDISKLAEYGEMGFEVYADIAEKKWVFDVIEGVDRSKEQDVVSPVFFNMEILNLLHYKYTEDYQNYRNTGYAGGKGEDEKRLMQILGAENTGYDRFETFLDCGNVDLDDLLYYGNIKLSELKEAKTLETRALPKVFIFDKDYFLGDRVTIYLSKLGLTLHSKITGVKEVWEREVGYTTELRFGYKIPNAFDVLGTNISQKSEVR